MSREKKLRLAAVLSIWTLAVASLVAYVIHFNLRGFGLPCTFHLLTGLDCPSCGMSRALSALSKLDFVSSLSYNPFLIPAGIYFLAYSLSFSVSFVRGNLASLKFLRPFPLHPIFFAAWLIFAVLRNII